MIGLDPHEAFLMHGPTFRVLHREYMAGKLQVPAQMGGTEVQLTKVKNVSTKNEGFILTIPLVGMMTRYGEACARGSEDVIRLIAEFNTIPDFKAAVLELDGPGGQASGTRELYMAIKNSPKPIYAFIKGMAASAHYYVAAACKAVYAESNTSQVGSIGALMAIEMNADDKKETVILRARGSENKALVNGIEPLTDDLKKGLIDNLTVLRDLFVDDVKTTRPSLSDAATKGDVFMANKAKSLGLIDGIKTKEEFMKYLTKQI